MSSGFVSGGTIDEPTERDDEWRHAQQELEEGRRRKVEIGQQDGGKSLYEVLQQNKMAKQEAFEESIRLKNQFRSLDEDEVEFLDSVLESTRAQEAAVKKETAEQLAAFHRQRKETDRALLENTASSENLNVVGGPLVSSVEEEQWAIAGRKRKRSKKDSLFPGKIRRSSTAEGGSERKVSSDVASPPVPSGKQEKARPLPSSTSLSTGLEPSDRVSPVSPKHQGIDTKSVKEGNKALDVKTPPAKSAAPAPTLGLVAYSSDED